jgi:general L-amino acid transport system substrate-binding protein
MTPHPFTIFLVAAAMLVAAVNARAETVLDHAKSMHRLTCGVVIDEDDFSKADRHGNLAVLGADFCKALGAAALGNDAKVEILAFRDEPEGLRGVRAGVVAVLVGATPNVGNAADFAVGFGPVLFYDGQGFLVAKKSRIATFQDLAGKQVCFISGTDAEATLNSTFSLRKIAYLPFPFEERGEMEAALFTGHCQAITGDVSELASFRRMFRARARDFMILPGTIAKDPFAPAYRLGDPQWAAIVSWTVSALIEAEEDGVTAANVKAMTNSEDLRVRLLLGTTPGIGRTLGLDDAWAERAIAVVGNYGEIYERDVGRSSPLKLDRGLNALWTHGGLIYAQPLH